MKMRLVSFGFLLTLVLGAQESDFTVQLPPISTTVVIEDVELTPLEKWPAEDEPVSDIASYLLPVLNSDLVISVPMPDPVLPQTVKTDEATEEEEG